MSKVTKETVQKWLHDNFTGDHVLKESEGFTTPFDDWKWHGNSKGVYLTNIHTLERASELFKIT